MRKGLSPALVGSLVALAFAGWIFGQSNGSEITGVVRDSSGAALPKVEVEATSPALMARSAKSFGPPGDVFEKSSLPQPNDFLRYALSLPITTAVSGIESMETLSSVLRGVPTFKKLNAADMHAIHQRAKPLASTGYWIPRPSSRAV